MRDNQMKVVHNNARRSNTNDRQKHHTSAAENRFRRVMFKLRGMHWSKVSDKKTQTDIAHLVHRVTTYGFGFFPNHYVMDDIIELEKIEKRLSA